MSANAFIDNAKVMSKGQITIPKDVRTGLCVKRRPDHLSSWRGSIVRLGQFGRLCHAGAPDRNGRGSAAHRVEFRRGCDGTCEGNEKRGRTGMRVLIDTNVLISCRPECRWYAGIRRMCCSHPNHGPHLRTECGRDKTDIQQEVPL